MKKQYENPIINVITVSNSDVITTSNFGENLPGLNPDNNILG